MRKFFSARGFVARKNLFRQQTRAFEQAQWLVKIYYAGLLSIPIFSQKRWARILAFLGVFEFVALSNSFGKIGHSMHLWVLSAFLLIFLPCVEKFSDEPPRVFRQRYLLIFWSCQAIVLLTYSMSGLGKIAGAVYQMSAGQNNIFLPGAFAVIAADRLQQTNSPNLLGWWLSAHLFAGWPFMLADLYLQFFSFWAAFRPSLHRSWAIALILFHIASYLFLSINFAPSVLLITIILLNSPFALRGNDWRQWLSDLPLFGKIFHACAS